MQNPALKFQDRAQAGRQLAQRLESYKGMPNLLVLGLPRGGVPVAYEIAKSLNAPLDICLVRKLGVPAHKELAMGAIASGGVKELNYEIINSIGISNTKIEEVLARELEELHRRELVYRQDRQPRKIKDQIVILVDDGMATGSTMRAAIRLIKKQQPAKLIVAVPVAHPSAYVSLSSWVDQVICLTQPKEFYAIGLWYENFDQTSDQEVCNLLSQVS